MTEPGNTSGTENKESSLDLNSLLGEGAFGPSWASGKESTKKYADHKGLDEDRGDRKRKGSGKPRDRRQGQRPSGDRRQERPGGRGQGERRPNRNRNQQRPYRPEFDIQLQPHPTAFAALIKAMRESCRTFELFEISRLFLSKSDRFVAKVLPKGSNPGNPHHAKKPEPPKEGSSEEQIFYISIPDGIGFEHEGEVIDHVLGNHLDKFFEIEKVEKDPPKGSFSVVNRCTVTDTLLAPPNYHRYQHILQEHYASKIHAMAFERFESKIETVREQEAVDQWLESMKTGYTYKAKDTGEEFQHMEDARRHLLMNHKAKIVRTANTIRIEGKDLEKLPKNRIRRSIEAVLEKQLKVPLDFSNHLRGRLRRANFTIYKRGGKGGITYACAVKRQNRTPDTAFSDSIQSLVEFIEKNPEITTQRILQSIKPEEEKQEETPTSTPAEETPPQEETATTETPETTAEIEESKEVEAAPAEEAKAADEEHSQPDATESSAPADQESEQSQEVPKADKAPEASTEPQKAEPKEKASEPEPKEEKPLVGEIPVSETLAQDLRWLVQYGYVTEYSDGRLFAPPIRIEPINVPASKEGESATEDSKTQEENQEVLETPSQTEEIAQSVEVDSQEEPNVEPAEAEPQVAEKEAVTEPEATTEEASSEEPAEPTPEVPPAEEEPAESSPEAVDTSTEPEATEAVSTSQETNSEESKEG